MEFGFKALIRDHTDKEKELDNTDVHIQIHVQNEAINSTASAAAVGRRSTENVFLQ